MWFPSVLADQALRLLQKTAVGLMAYNWCGDHVQGKNLLWNMLENNDYSITSTWCYRIDTICIKLNCNLSIATVLPEPAVAIKKYSPHGPW